MAHLLRKIQLTVTFLLVATVGYAYGDCAMESSCVENENCFSCEPSCRGKGFISAELLYWRAFQSGLDVCVPREVSERVTDSGRIISRFRGKGRNPHFKWNPGFRIAAGYESF